MQFASLLLAASVSISAPVHLPSLVFVAGGASDDEDSDSDGDGDYKAALKALEKANIKVNNDPETHMALLADAIETIKAFSRELADDRDGSRRLDLAMLNLARAMLRSKDRDGAGEVMDELLRRSDADKLPVQRFGPTLVEFYESRLDTLTRAGTAEIQFKCEVSCRVLLDRHTVTTRSGPLYLGTYEVEIESADGSLPTERQEITLDEPGTVMMLRYPLAGLEPADEAPQPPRLAPRWAEVLMTVVGVSAVGAGAALLAIDGKCPGGGDPINDAGELCPTLYEASAAGATILGLGAAVFGGGVVLLSVDEVRSKSGRKDRQAMVYWNWRF